MLPEHGKIKCSKCFDHETIWGKSIFEKEGWRLENNPGSWGSSNPLILILGFSKGTNQTNKLFLTPFNDIPFKGMRSFLSQLLRRLGLLSDYETVDNKISSQEKDFAFSSLIKCSISKFDNCKEKFIKSGDIINSSAKDKNAQRIISNCMNTFLKDLPERLKIIIMLSNDDKYMDACFESFSKIYTGLKRINQVSYTNGKITWIHTIHPSGASGKHRIDWLNASSGKQAMKRDLALETIKKSGILEITRLSIHNLQKKLF